MKSTLHTRAVMRQLRHIIREEVKRLMVHEAIEFNPYAVFKVVKKNADLQRVYNNVKNAWRPMEKDMEIIFKSHILGNPHVERDYKSMLRTVKN